MVSTNVENLLIVTLSIYETELCRIKLHNHSTISVFYEFEICERIV